jgi:hypothetical protein
MKYRLKVTDSREPAVVRRFSRDRYNAATIGFRKGCCAVPRRSVHSLDVVRHEGNAMLQGGCYPHFEFIPSPSRRPQKDALADLAEADGNELRGSRRHVFNPWVKATL